MQQIYKVFYNDRCILISDKIKLVDKAHIFLCQSSTKAVIKKCIADFQRKKIETNCLQLVHLEPQKVFDLLCSMYKVVEAAGGLVKNTEGKILAIKRMGCWDFPKGKIEKGETARACAIREVMEECGIAPLKIARSLTATYHTYEIKDKKILKKNYWFEMLYEGKKKAIPQENEGITEVKWVSCSALRKLKKNMYPSLWSLVDLCCK